VLPLVLPSFFLAQSRGAIIALLVAVVCNLTRSWLIFALLVIALAGFSYLTFRYGDNIRLVVWRQALDNLTLMGNGAGSFQDVFIMGGKRLWHAEYAHNEYLQLVFEFGLGAAFLLLPVALLALRTDAREWPIFVCFLVMALYSWPVHSYITAFIGALVAGRLVASWDVVWRRRLARRHGFVVWAG
jgi:hypothetical protein